MSDQVKNIIEIIIGYFLEVFKFFGFIDQEDIDNAQAEIDKFKPVEE